MNEKIAQLVTTKLLEKMEKGKIPWKKPWNAIEETAVSHSNGKAYSLLNQILLEFRGGEYLTFNQVKKEGGMVKKGSKSQTIVFWCRGFNKTIENEEGEKKTVFVEYKVPVLKAYQVFHIDDCIGLKKKYTCDNPEARNYDFEKDTKAEDIATLYCEREGIILKIEEGNRASYSPSLDRVRVPLREQFMNPEEFYSTLYHELTHSTGHEKRLNRIKTGEIHFGDENYSREELVAEIGSAMCLAHFGIDSEKATKNNVAYLQHWSEFLKDDPMAFIVAAGKAEKAVNLIFNFNTKEEIPV